MTRPARPASAAGGEVVEIDAMDGMEWEQGQHTPQANDANLAALVKETASAPEPAPPESPRKTPLTARGRVTASVIPQRPRAGDTATQSAQPAARSAPPSDHSRQVTPPADAGRAGSPAVELAASSAGMTAFDPTPELASSADMEAFGPTREYATSSAGPHVLAPAAELAVSSAGMAPLPRLFDDAPPDGPRRVDSSRAAPGSPPSLNDILRAAPRPVWADSATAPAMSPLHASVETAPNPAPLPVREPAPPPSEALAASMPGGRLGSSAWRRLVLVIGGTAGGAALVIALLVMTGGKPDEHPTPPPVDDHVEGPAVPAQAVAAPVASPARPVAAPARPAALPDPEPPARRVPLALAPASRPGPIAPASEPRRRSARKLAAKKLVVDYSTRSEPAMPGLVAQPAEEPAIGLARTAYLSGNQQLFAGDAEGAIRAYRESLDLYPGYVGGYRGLGLAYAQLGDNRNALEAFKMYVGTVPNARDVALIKKRIARLQGR